MSERPKSTLAFHLSLKRDVFDPLFTRAGEVYMNSSQKEDAIKVVCNNLGLAEPQQWNFDTQNGQHVVNDTAELLHFFGIFEDSCDGLVNIHLTNHANRDHPLTPHELLYTEAALSNETKTAVDNFLSNGGILLTMTRREMSPDLTNFVLNLADELHVHPDKVVKQFKSGSSMIPLDHPKHNQLVGLEQVIQKGLDQSIMFYALPPKPENAEEAQKLEKDLNDAVEPLEQVYVNDLLRKGLTTQELRALKKSLIPLGLVGAGIAVGEIAHVNNLVDLLLMMGGDVAMFFTQAHIQKERQHLTSLKEAVRSRIIELPINVGIAFLCAHQMDIAASQHDFKKMAGIFAAGMMSTALVSVVVNGTTGMKKHIPDNISALKNNPKRIREIMRYSLRNFLDSLESYYRNPATKGSFEGSVFSSLWMNFFAQATNFFEVPVLKWAVETVAGLGETSWLFARIGFNSASDWLLFCSMVNEMIESEKNGKEVHYNELMQ